MQIWVKEREIWVSSFAILPAQHAMVNNKDKYNDIWKGPGRYSPAHHLQMWKSKFQLSMIHLKTR